MDAPSPLINELLDYLGEAPVVGSDPNMTTLLRQGQVAQEWLLTHYLASWLELIGGLVECKYPLARAHRVQLRALSGLSEHLDPKSSDVHQVTRLHSIETLLQSTLRTMNRTPQERDLQWGIWARDVPVAIAHGFRESTFMNPMICDSIAPCCMYAAFLVSQVVTDQGVADEIVWKMFEEKPRALIARDPVGSRGLNHGQMTLAGRERPTFWRKPETALSIALCPRASRPNSAS